MAKRLGADRTVDITSEDIFAVIHELTGGRGVDVLLECSGSPKAVDSGLLLTRKAGQYTQIGLFGKPLQVDFEKICFRGTQSDRILRIYLDRLGESLTVAERRQGKYQNPGFAMSCR